MDMKSIVSVSNQLERVCERICSLSESMDETALTPVYESLLLDEIGHAQILTLELTRLVTSDESISAEDDLTSERKGVDDDE